MLNIILQSRGSMQNSIFFRQAKFLLRVLPIISSDSDLALKGGTAINFFIRNMPRLSVDIDLVYLPLNTREEALGDIKNKLINIAAGIKNMFPLSREIESIF